MEQASGIKNAHDNAVNNMMSRYTDKLMESEAGRRAKETLEGTIGMELIQAGMSSGRLGDLGKHLLHKGLGRLVLGNESNVGRAVSAFTEGGHQGVVDHFARQGGGLIRGHTDGLFPNGVGEQLRSHIRNSYSSPEEASKSLGSRLVAGLKARYDAFQEKRNTYQRDDYNPFGAEGDKPKPSFTSYASGIRDTVRDGLQRFRSRGLPSDGDSLENQIYGGDFGMTRDTAAPLSALGGGTYEELGGGALPAYDFSDPLETDGVPERTGTSARSTLSGLKDKWMSTGGKIKDFFGRVKMGPDSSISHIDSLALQDGGVGAVTRGPLRFDPVKPTFEAAVESAKAAPAAVKRTIRSKVALPRGQQISREEQNRMYDEINQRSAYNRSQAAKSQVAAQAKVKLARQAAIERGPTAAQKLAPARAPREPLPEERPSLPEGGEPIIEE